MLLRIAVAGTVDFKKARLLDPDWWRHTLTLARAAQHELHREYLHAEHRHYLAIVSSGLFPLLNAEVQGQIYSESWNILNAVWNDLRPWDRRDEQKQKAQAEQLAELYKQHAGDTRDPAFQAEMAKVIEEMKGRKAQVAKDQEAVKAYADRLAAAQRKRRTPPQSKPQWR